jgi:hypothetical protein
MMSRSNHKVAKKLCARTIRSSFGGVTNQLPPELLLMAARLLAAMMFALATTAPALGNVATAPANVPHRSSAPTHYFDSASDWVGYSEYLTSGGADPSRSKSEPVAGAATATRARRRGTKDVNVMEGFFSGEVSSVFA